MAYTLTSNEREQENEVLEVSGLGIGKSRTKPGCRRMRDTHRNPKSVQQATVP